MMLTSLTKIIALIAVNSAANIRFFNEAYKQGERVISKQN